MPLPLFLGIGAAAAAAAGIGSGIHGAAKLKDANDTMKSAQSRHEFNVKKFEKKNSAATTTMDQLGKLELEILNSFETFSETFEKIQNKPEFTAYSKQGVTLPQYDPESLKTVSVGAGVLLGGLSGAALGTAGGFAAAGATTAAVMALGTASTGTAIASLSGVAATNATLAALGGGAIAAGGGGIALGTTMLGVTTLGVGLLVGGIIFNFTGMHLSNKADKAWSQAMKAEEEINKICVYLNSLKDTASDYLHTLSRVNEIYQRHLTGLTTVVNLLGKTDWRQFSEEEKLMTKNLVLMVGLLYQMCKVQLVLKSDQPDALNTINKSEVKTSIDTADYLLADRGLA